jgi:hypothetical protein
MTTQNVTICLEPKQVDDLIDILCYHYGCKSIHGDDKESLKSFNLLKAIVERYRPIARYRVENIKTKSSTGFSNILEAIAFYNKVHSLENPHDFKVQDVKDLERYFEYIDPKHPQKIH